MNEPFFTVVVKAPLAEPVIKEIGTDYRDIYPELGCSCFECVELDNNITMFCDEEGKLKPNIPNILIYDGADIVFGTVLFAGNGDEGETTSLTSEQINFVMQYIKENEL